MYDIESMGYNCVALHNEMIRTPYDYVLMCWRRRYLRRNILLVRINAGVTRRTQLDIHEGGCGLECLRNAPSTAEFSRIIPDVIIALIIPGGSYFAMVIECPSHQWSSNIVAFD